ncbi:MAG TPA: hypothetical protein VFR11_03520, partial [Micromonosporaceae bacterium]|nr:hypothetical protein [Micromonosporaceae bacterium]
GMFGIGNEPSAHFVRRRKTDKMRGGHGGQGQLRSVARRVKLAESCVRLAMRCRTAPSASSAKSESVVLPMVMMLSPLALPESECVGAGVACGRPLLARLLDHEHDVAFVIAELGQPELAMRRGCAREETFNTSE